MSRRPLTVIFFVWCKQKLLCPGKGGDYFGGHISLGDQEVENLVFSMTVNFRKLASSVTLQFSMFCLYHLKFCFKL